MQRWWIVFGVVISIVSCGPDNKPQQQCSGKPDFVVTVSAANELLPSDTLLSVKFGGDGQESYRPNAHNERQVLFCDAALASDAGGAGGSGNSETLELAGAGGAHDDVATIRSITCELWTGGPAWVTVHAGEWEASQPLTPKSDVCTVWNSIVLGPLPEL
jgi:hypothetical protein